MTLDFNPTLTWLDLARTHTKKIFNNNLQPNNKQPNNQTNKQNRRTNRLIVRRFFFLRSLPLSLSLSLLCICYSTVFEKQPLHYPRRNHVTRTRCFLILSFLFLFSFFSFLFSFLLSSFPPFTILCVSISSQNDVFPHLKMMPTSFWGP